MKEVETTSTECYCGKKLKVVILNKDAVTKIECPDCGVVIEYIILERLIK